jgi:hypothetical protein
VEGVDQESLRGAASGEIELPLQEPPSGPGRTENEDQGDCRGYRRIHVLLRREGWMVNVKLVNRLYRDMGLQLRNKTPKRKVKAKLREDRQAPPRRNDVWAMDFVHDQLFDGRKTRILTIVDAFTRYSPAIEPRLNWRGIGVSRYWIGFAGKPAFRERSASIRDRSSSPRILNCGRIGEVWCLTSHGLANRQIMLSSSH